MENRIKEKNNTQTHNQVFSKSKTALKWSAISQILSKLILPITNMILARILAREIFGIVATLSIIVTFGEIFADAGFSKYLVQKEFDSEEKKTLGIYVAFWTNLIVSLLTFVLILIFNSSLAKFIGSEGYGWVLVVTSIQIPLFGISSVFTSILMRNFKYKELFFIRIIGVIVSFVVSITLAVSGFTYWSLVFSSLFISVITLVLSWIFSRQKIKFIYSLEMLKEMFSFSFVSFIDSFLTWMSSFTSVFILSYFFDHDTIGLYKTSTSTINGIISIFSATFISVLFSTLSRVQDNNEKFVYFYELYQKIAAFIIIPASIGIFLTRELITMIMLGPNWLDASFIIGFSGLFNGLFILMRPFPSTYILSKGKPIYIAITQLMYLIISIPLNFLFASFSFNEFVISSSVLTMLLGVFTNFILWYKYKLKILNNLWNTYKFLIPTTIMVGAFYLFQLVLGTSPILVFVNIICSSIIYFAATYLFFHKDVNNTIQIILKKDKMKIIDSVDFKGE